MAGYGPDRGWNGAEGATGGGAFGLTEVMNCGVVKFKHDWKSTVDPRYCEHLREESQHRFIRLQDGASIPIVQCGPRHKRHIPYDIHILRVEPDHNALRGKRDTSRILHHRDSVSEREALVLQPVYSMRRLEDGSSWNVLDERFLVSGGGFAICVEGVRESFDLRDRCLFGRRYR